MADIKNIDWNVGSVLATLAAIGFLAVQVYIMTVHTVGLSMIGNLF